MEFLFFFLLECHSPFNCKFHIKLFLSMGNAMGARSQHGTCISTGIEHRRRKKNEKEKVRQKYTQFWLIKMHGW